MCDILPVWWFCWATSQQRHGILLSNDIQPTPYNYHAFVNGLRIDVFKRRLLRNNFVSVFYWLLQKQSYTSVTFIATWWEYISMDVKSFSLTFGNAVNKLNTPTNFIVYAYGCVQRKQDIHVCAKCSQAVFESCKPLCWNLPFFRCITRWSYRFTSRASFIRAKWNYNSLHIIKI